MSPSMSREQVEEVDAHFSHALFHLEQIKKGLRTDSHQCGACGLTKDDYYSEAKMHRGLTSVQRRLRKLSAEFDTIVRERATGKFAGPRSPSEDDDRDR